ncbi:MAG: protein kinase [Acidobacteria bacterium]|nr:protein kinase [Acidobacteriota bacterium]
MSLLTALVGQTLDNKYRIEKQLGQGGMGAVYMATHIGTLRPVALKVIAPQFMAYPEFVERFRREAEAAGRLRHPNVVNVTDFGFAEVYRSKLAYLVMEYLDGCNLGDVLREEKKLPLSWVVDILEQTCLAVEKAHQQGIIHRDLKPDNIWLEPNERGGFTVKVLDFGLAKLAVPLSDNQNQIKSSFAMPESLETLGTLGNSKNSKNSYSNDQIDSDFQEAITNVQLIDSEGQTAIQSSNSKSSSDQEKTNIQLSSTTSDLEDEEKTAVQAVSSKSTNKENNRQTQSQSKEKLTQAGAVLGTPLYMSPEQCLGEELDKRSDIYSLGVIAYEMLAGELPFSGKLKDLIKSHTNLKPPSLEEKRPDIPKAVADLITKALSKNIKERPISVAAFASALRARSEGASVIVSQVLGLYFEHFSTFFQISLIGFIPTIISSIVSISQIVLLKTMPTSPILGIAQLAIFISIILSMMFSQAINGGVSVPVLAQLLIAPLKSISIQPAFQMLKKRLRVFLFPAFLLSTSEVLMLFSTAYLFGSSMSIYRKFELIKQDPGNFIGLWLWMIVYLALAILTYKVFIEYALYPAVTIIEGIGGRAALRKSKELYLANKTPTKIVAISFLVFFIIHTIISVCFGIFVIRPSSLLVALFASLLFYSLHTLVLILTNPLFAIALGLIYFNTRQTNGELLKDILAQYQPEALLLSNWQTRIAKAPTNVLQSLMKSDS